MGSGDEDETQTPSRYPFSACFWKWRYCGEQGVEPNPVFGRRKVRIRVSIATNTAAAHRKILEGQLLTGREREAADKVRKSRTGKDRFSRDDYGDGNPAESGGERVCTHSEYEG